MLDSDKKDNLLLIQSNTLATPPLPPYDGTVAPPLLPHEPHPRLKAPFIPKDQNTGMVPQSLSCCDIQFGQGAVQVSVGKYALRQVASEVVNTLAGKTMD